MGFLIVFLNKIGFEDEVKVEFLGYVEISVRYTSLFFFFRINGIKPKGYSEEIL